MNRFPTPKRALWCLSAALGLGLAPGFGSVARANILSDIGQSISSLWRQKGQKQSAARSAISKARAQTPQVEFLHDRLERTQRLLASANGQYRNYFRQMRATETQLRQTRAQSEEVAKRYREHRAQFGQRLAAMQRHGQTNYLQITLGSQSFSDLTRRTAFFQALTQRDAQLQAQLKADKAQLSRLQNNLMTQWAARDALQKQANRERERIAQGQAQQAAMWRQLKSSRQNLLAYAAAQQKSSQEITGMISSLEARKAQIYAAYEAQAAREREAARYQAALRYQARERAAERALARAGTRIRTRRVRYARESRPPRYSRRRNFTRMPYMPQYAPRLAPRVDLTPRYAPRIELAPMPLSALSSSASGTRGWTLPARGRLSSRFGMRRHPVSHRGKMHTGADIAASHGSPIRAAKGGRVLWAGWKKAYGNTIIVDNGGGVTTLYAHASKLGVRPGQPIASGQNIGNVGSTGFSTGPHLHFEVRKNGRPVNPTQFLGGHRH